MKGPVILFTSRINTPVKICPITQWNSSFNDGQKGNCAPEASLFLNKITEG